MKHINPEKLLFLSATAFASCAPLSDLPAEKPAMTKNGKPDPSDASGFVDLSDVIPDLIVELRYYSDYNFVGERIAGYEEPVALLCREAAEALKKANELLNEQGYLLKLYDAYRPQTAVDRFVEWASNPEDVRMKAVFYPDVDKKDLFKEGYIDKRSGHSRGSKVDVTLVDRQTGKDVDMGGPFDFFGELSHPDYKQITEAQYRNRMILREAMLACGFRPCATEWWDFLLSDEPYPDIYFTFPVSRSSLGSD